MRGLFKLLASLLLLAAHPPVCYGLVTRVQGRVGEYCGGDAPLSTPYLAAFHKREEVALGCQADSPTDAVTQVHVVRLTGRLPEVFLNVAGEQASSLVLMSAVETTWHLATSSASALPTILVSVGSKVMEAGTGRELDSSPALLNSINTASKIALNRFGHLNTVTTVTGEANRVFVQVPQSLGSDQSCLGQTRAKSIAVKAYMVERQSSFGCYHPEAAGLLPNDVHVIDLRDRTGSGQNGRRLRRSVAEEQLPEVVVELGPELTEGEVPPLPRNLTLVLKSDSRVRWMLKSSGIQGRLLVTAGDPVEKVEVGAGQHLEIQQAAMPDQFDQMMEEVTREYGQPLSYLRVHHANLLEMTIPPRSKRELAQLMEERQRPAETSRPLSSSYSLDERIYSAAEAIESVMEKSCNEEKKEMAVSIPTSTIDQLGVGAITLNDASCRANPVGDVWSITSHSTKCGSTALIQGSVPMFRNNLNIRFNSGPLAGQHTRISFICKFRPCIPGVSCTADHDDDDEEEDDYTDEMEEGEEMYSMSVKLAATNHKTSDKISLLEKRSDSATVRVGDEIHVSSHINAVPYLALAMEQCWLSTSPKPSSHARPQDTRLIATGCPARSDVSLHWDEGSSNSAFSFKVSKNLKSKVWLQCRMGLCSATNAGAGGNILRCIEPSTSCRAGAPPHQESTLQQVTVRGPLHVVQAPRNSLHTGHLPRGNQVVNDEDEDEEDEEGEKKQSANHSSRILVEVPVEVAIAISLASFMVGALSTGVLWFIHSRALRAKSEQLRIACEGTELVGLSPTTANNLTSNGAARGGDHNGNCPSCPLVS